MRKFKRGKCHFCVGVPLVGRCEASFKESHWFALKTFPRLGCRVGAIMSEVVEGTDVGLGAILISRLLDVWP